MLKTLSPCWLGNLLIQIFNWISQLFHHFSSGPAKSNKRRPSSLLINTNLTAAAAAAEKVPPTPSPSFHYNTRSQVKKCPIPPPSHWKTYYPSLMKKEQNFSN